MTAVGTPPGVVAVDPRTDPRWARLAAGPEGSLFTSPPWIHAVSETYGFQPVAQVALADGAPVGGVSWVPVHDMRGYRLVSLPFCDRADPLVRNPAIWRLLSADAVDSGHPFTIRCLDDRVPCFDSRLRCVGEAAWHGTSLAVPADRLWSQLAPAARRNVRMAERSGVRVSLERGLEAVRVFHQLHVRLRKRKYRLLAPPLEFFERIWGLFAGRDAIRTALADVDGVAVAGAMFLVWNDVAYYKFGASLAEYLPLRPNDAIAWAALRWAQNCGLTLLDWGLSDLDQPGLIAYKRKWSADGRRIVMLQSGDADVGRQPMTDGILRQLTTLLTDERLPDDITARAGEVLYRLFC